MKEYGDGEGHVTFNGFVTMMAKKLKDKDSEAELTEALRCECILLSFAMHVDVGVRVKVVCARLFAAEGEGETGVENEWIAEAELQNVRAKPAATSDPPSSGLSLRMLAMHRCSRISAKRCRQARWRL